MSVTKRGNRFVAIVHGPVIGVFSHHDRATAMRMASAFAWSHK